MIIPQFHALFQTDDGLLLRRKLDTDWFRVYLKIERSMKEADAIDNCLLVKLGLIQNLF